MQVGGNWETVVREKAIYVELPYQTLSLSPSPDRPYLDLLRKHEKAIQASGRKREREREAPFLGSTVVGRFVH